MWGNEQLIGTVIDGKYRVDRLIGNGGMGAVYAGTHLLLGRLVAIKVLRSDVHADSIAHARFVREAQASARIEHPNAIHVYDFGTISGIGSYLVMEFADGVSLRELLVERRRLPIDVALDILRQTAAALEAAHANGVVHRDVKPENLMICFDVAGRPVVKVVDFGIAKLVSTDGSTQLTSPQDLIGTPRYMAPEIFTGEDVDGRVDVYALGVVLFEMLTARPPFDGTFSEVIGKHIYTKPPTLAEFGLEVSDEVEQVIARALAKSVDDRYERPLDLAAAFAEACGPEVARAVPPPAPYLLYTPPSDWEESLAEALTVPAFAAASEAGPHTRVVGSMAAPRRPVSPDRPFSRIDVPLEPELEDLTRARAAVPAPFAPAVRRTWSMPAAVALAAVLSFGVLSVSSQEPPQSWLAGAARPSVIVLEPEPSPAVAEAKQTSEPNRAPRRRARRTSDDQPAAARSDSGLRRVGRALRLDRHLRRIF